MTPRPAFVDVALVSAPDQVGPTVEVEIIPVTELRRLGQLKALGERLARAEDADAPAVAKMPR